MNAGTVIGFSVRPLKGALKASLLTTALAFSFATAALAPASAQSVVRISDGQSDSAIPVTVQTGKSFVVDLPRDAREVFVANPAVANAVVRGNRKVFVIATGLGQTSIYFVDTSGNQMGTIAVNVEMQTENVKDALDRAIPGNTIEVARLDKGLMLTGTVASADEASRAQGIAIGFVDNDVKRVANNLTIRGRDQVMLKVSVSEVQRQVLKQLGVNLTGLQAGSVSGQLVNPFPMNPALSDSFFRISGRDGTAMLQAFERTGVMRTLAEPTLTAISGEQARFLAGGEIPVLTSSNYNEDSGRYTYGYNYKKIGVQLTFVPVVINEGRISLHVSTEVTDIDYQYNIPVNGTAIPSFKTRQAETTVELPSGGTLGMAGMVQTNMRQVINGTPGLMNIPILGTLFRSRDYQRNETELMILVTPYIVKAVDRKNLSLPTDGFADATDPSGWLLGRVNRVYGRKAPAVANRGKYGFIVD